MNKLIYVQINGEMVRTKNKCQPERNNFVIQWRGMDWSGFRTLAECERQFSEFSKEKDDFTVVEK